MTSPWRDLASHLRPGVPLSAPPPEPAAPAAPKPAAAPDPRRPWRDLFPRPPEPPRE